VLGEAWGEGSEADVAALVRRTFFCSWRSVIEQIEGVSYVLCVMRKLQRRCVAASETSVSRGLTEQWDDKWVSESVHRPTGRPSHQPPTEVKAFGQEYVLWISFEITELAVVPRNCSHCSCDQHCYSRPNSWLPGWLNFGGGASYFEHQIRNRKRQVTVQRSFQNYGTYVWSLLHLTLLVPRILKWLVHNWTLCGLTASIYTGGPRLSDVRLLHIINAHP
jgi:hypothetical protein